MEKLKDALLEKGCGSFVRLGRKFRSMDESGDRTLGLDEFKTLIRSLDITEEAMPDVEVEAVFKTLDADSSGGVELKELQKVLMEPPTLPSNRMPIVTKAFKKLDKTGDGIVTLDDLKGSYNLKSNSEYKNGTKTEDQLLTEFLNVYEADAGTRDGTVTLDEFVKYYAIKSKSMSNDQYFEELVKDTWDLWEN